MLSINTPDIVLFSFYIGKMNTAIVLLFIKVLSLPPELSTLLPSAVIKCEEEKSPKNITWPKTPAGSYVSSDPPCISSKNEIEKRYCSESGCWDPEPDCHNIQKKYQCPKDFLYNENLHICYTVLKTKFPPKCPYDDVDVSFEFLKSDITQVFSDNVRYWMPVRRNLTNGFGFFEWVEKNEDYKNTYEECLNFQSTKILGNDCLLFYATNNRSSFYYIPAPCEEENYAICAYNQTNFPESPFCRSQNCKKSSYDWKSPCFCLGSGNGSNYKKIEIQQNYQNLVIDSSKKCQIALEKRDGRYFWSNSDVEIDYTYWDQNATFDEFHKFGAVSSKGWFLLTDDEKSESDCFWFQENPREVSSYLDLTTNEGNSNFLHLTVIQPIGLKKSGSGEVMVFCFTDATDLNLTYKYTALSPYTGNNEENITFSFERSLIGPGNYWCEVFKYPNLELVVSNTVLLRPEEFDFEFVAILEIDLNAHFNTSSDIYSFKNTLLTQMNQRLKENYYTARIMKLLDFNEQDTTVTMNIHLTSKRQTTCIADQPTVDDAYWKLPILLEESLSRIEIFKIINDFKFNFRNSDFCLSETTKFQEVTLTWPTTHPAKSSFPKEYCFKNFRRYSRICIGNFIDGCEFEKIEPCHLLEFSPITPSLVDLRQTQLQNSSLIWNLALISENFSDFLELDVYLVAEILAALSGSALKCISLQDLTTIVNNLLKINQNILHQSQNLTNSSNIILAEIDRLVFTSDETIEKTDLENFLLVVSDKDNCIGVSMNQDTAHLLRHNENIEDLIRQGDIEKAVALTEPDTSGRVAFMVFSKQFFFNDESVNKIHASFRVVFPGSDYSAPVQVLEKIKKGKRARICVQWHLKESLWDTVKTAENKSSFAKCEFSNQQTHLAIMHEATVTDNLLDLLSSEEAPAVIVEKLLNVSKRYEEFESNDLFFMGKLLEKISSDHEVDLQNFADIISNLHEINRGFLEQSQDKYQSTDTILYYTDDIIRNRNYTGHVEIVSKNFRIVKSDVKETNISGLFLETSEEGSIVNTIFGEYNQTAIQEYESVEDAVFLSQQLKDQLRGDSVVSFTVFPRSSLFNGDSTTSKRNINVNKVFGILLPKLEKQDGPISIIHKVPESSDMKYCVYWKYDMEHSLRGLWSLDNNIKNYNQWTECTFWHTTHFAILVMSHEISSNYEVLDIITMTNCTLSLIGLFLIALTAVLFRSWRCNTGNKILLHFDFALTLQIVSFLISASFYNELKYHPYWCTLTGIILHYAFISQFCWMLVIAYLQFRRFVEVLGGPPQHILLKACFCGWVLPIVPVACVYFFDSENYVRGIVGLCYPSGLGLYYGVWLPVIIIIVINLTMFVFIMYNVCYKRSECYSGVYNHDILFQWRLAILLFFMLGLSWVFGFLVEVDFGWIFLYLFCFTASAQGFAMFLFFIVFNQNTRHLYYERIKKIYLGDKYY